MLPVPQVVCGGDSVEAGMRGWWLGAACLSLVVACGDPIVGGPDSDAGVECVEGSGNIPCDGMCVDPSTDDANCGACGVTCGADEVCREGSCQLPCLAAETQCGDVCADLSSDVDHCGACGVECAEGEVCSEGTCGLSCGGSTPVRCDDSCVDTDSNRDHCGACGVECAEGEVCSGGACGLSCGGTTPTLCDDACVDTQTDRTNCGSCGNVCPEGQFCSDGTCGLACGGETPTLCGTRCVDTQIDRNHCGGCDMPCGAGELCSDGACGLSCGGDTPTQCGTRCVDTDTDRQHCGGCDMPCGPGEVCSDGTCSLSCGGDTPTQCGSACVDTDTDRAHCGGCDMPCAAGEVCSDGSCGLSCGGDTPTLCGSACVDTDTDRAHCGGCDMPCAAGEVCSGGTCGLSCGGDTPTLCGAACVDTDTNRFHCGACDDACPSGEVCIGGACTLGCGGATPDLCAGGCVDTQSNRLHCGACDNACGAGEVCSLGACVASCGSGLSDCSGSCVDTDTDPANCGGCGTTCAMAPESAGVCIGGSCSYFCEPGFGDCNGDLGMAGGDGCETSLVGSALNCGACGSTCGAGDVCMGGACIQTTSTREDDEFSTGDRSGTDYDMDAGGLVLDSTAAVDDFLWIPNTAESSMSKWDARTNTEVGRYRVGLPSGECVGSCCWNNGCNMPSRVVVDGSGDAYVANRGFSMQGTVTKIAANIDDCVDRNGNGMIDTSTGSTALPFDEDECVLWTAPVGPSNAVLRALAIDAGDTEHPEGYPWVGAYNTRQFWKLDPDTGAVLLGPVGVSINPYGAIVLSDGTLYASGLGTTSLAVFDTTSAAPTATTVTVPRPAGTPNWLHYGMTADANGRLWFSYANNIQGYDPATGQSTGSLAIPGGGSLLRGITVDSVGRVWAAVDASPMRLAYWDADAFVPNGLIDTAEITQITMPGGYTGASAVGADSSGIIWYANYNTPTALFRVDPATGDVTTSTGPNQVYSYSDFTGGVRRTVIATGTYDETFDALCDSPTWETLGFGVDTPAGTTVTFVGRTADTIAGLATADAVTIAEAPTDGTPADVLTAFMGAGVTPGRYFRLTTILAGEPGSTPVVRDYTLGWSCP